MKINIVDPSTTMKKSLPHKMGIFRISSTSLNVVFAGNSNLKSQLKNRQLQMLASLRQVRVNMYNLLQIRQLN
jgi:hypothetical protein